MLVQRREIQSLQLPTNKGFILALHSTGKKPEKDSMSIYEKRESTPVLKQISTESHRSANLFATHCCLFTASKQHLTDRKSRLCSTFSSTPQLLSAPFSERLDQ
jgi:hypothetical protein